MTAPQAGTSSGPLIFPQPFRPAHGHTAVTFARLPPSARVRIHAFSGLLVRELDADAMGTASWDGNNSSGRPAASGVYLVYVDGGGKKFTLKVIVQR